jgi:chromosome segregation ATPase
MSSENLLTDNGIKKLADQLSGYISYLNREQDPTQFAQPIMIEVPAIMSHIDNPELREQLFLQGNKDDKMAKKERNKQAADDKKQDTLHIKELNERLRETQKNIKSLLKNKQSKCKTIKNRDEKAKCMKDIKEGIERETQETLQSIKREIAELKTLEEKNKGLKTQEKQRVTELKKQLETLRNTLLQEVMLVERCKNIKLV